MNKHILEIKRLAKEFKCMGTYGLIELELTELEKQLESTEVVKEKCNLPVVSVSLPSAEDLIEAEKIAIAKREKQGYNFTFKKREMYSSGFYDAVYWMSNER